MTKKQVLACLNMTSMISPQEASFFYDRIIKLPEKGAMLDIGTGLGHSAAMFGRAKPGWIIYTVDIYKSYPDSRFDEEISISEIRKTTEYLRDRKVNNVIQIVGDSTKIPWNIPLNAIFIDGDHDYYYVKSDFDRFSPFLKKGGVVLFHDANLKDTKKFLQEIDARVVNRTIGIWRK